jgi:WD40 repeat protein
MLVLDAGGPVTQVRFLPDGQLLVGLRKGADGSVEVWPLPGGERVRIPLEHQAHWYRADQLAVHPAGDRVLFADGWLRTFATANGSLLPAPAVPDPDDLLADRVIVSPAGDVFVTAQGQPEDPWRLTVFDAAGRFVRRAEYPPPGPKLAGFLSDGDRYAAVYGNTLSVRRLTDDAQVAAAKVPSNHGPAPLLSPDGRHVGVIGYGSLYLYDLTALGKPRQIKGSGNFGNFVAVAFHPAGRTLAVVHGGPTLVKLYDLDTLTLRAKLNWKVGALTCVAYSPDGLLGAAGTADGRVVVWDVDE